MKKVWLVLWFLLSAACDGGTTLPPERPVNHGVDSPGGSGNSTVWAREFCTAQSQLLIVSSALQSAYSVLDNGSDMNYCGGEIDLDQDFVDFTIDITDYCFNFRSRPLTLNGNITGEIGWFRRRGSFTSEISNLNITGDGVDLSVTGRTWDGRGGDMSASLTIINYIAANDILLEDIAIDNGDMESGVITYSDLGRFDFNFTEHFNSDLTQGRLVFSGPEEELVIVAAEGGVITVIHKATAEGSGTLLIPNCGA